MFCMRILVSRTSHSSQNQLVSQRHGALQHDFETVLSQLLQFALPKFIHNKCFACEFWFLELHFLPQKQLVPRQRGALQCYFVTILSQLPYFALPKFIRNKCFAREIWFRELRTLPKSSWFLEGMTHCNGN